MDDAILHDEPLCKNGIVSVPDKPGLGIELNPEVVRLTWLKAKYGGTKQETKC